MNPMLPLLTLSEYHCTLHIHATSYVCTYANRVCTCICNIPHIPQGLYVGTEIVIPTPLKCFPKGTQKHKMRNICICLHMVNDQITERLKKRP
jgi:hypothetical protein